MEENIEEFERRYQFLVDDFKSGRIDETKFISEVNKLQLQDDWGRYWMLGSQTGSWHYYDGNDWHQADPRDRDKLPFMDDQGRYWQKGAKSGDWYYYQSETGEWVKPGQDDPSRPSTVHMGRLQSTPDTPSQAYYGHKPQETAYPDVGSTASFDNQLFQDDDGRYWALGTKTGQWYFYDETGWHPAHEYHSRAIPPPAPTSQAYFPQQATYDGPPQPVAPSPYQVYPPGQPTQAYPAAPQQAGYQPVQGALPPAQPQPGYDPFYQPPAGAPLMPAQPGAVEMPGTPQGTSQSGTWFYHDGDQWLKYSTGEPAEDSPPDPKLILEQDAASNESQEKSESEPVVAELFHDEQPPVEVVDVEVITVIDPEPEIEPEPKPKVVAAAAAAATVAAASAPPPEPAREEVTGVVTPKIDEYIPRRKRPSSKPQPPAAQPKPASKPVEPQPAAAPPRTPSESGYAVKPRKKTAPHEPTIIIPTGSTGESTPSPTIARARRPTRPVKPDRRRRARENTIPMEPMPLPGSAPPAPPPPAKPDSRHHRQVTQPLPRVSSASLPRAETNQVRATQRSRQPTKENVAQTPAPTNQSKPASEPQPGEKKYTFGDVLRSFPSTIWTLAAGLGVLIIFAFFFIGAISIFSGGTPDDTEASSAQLLTPTLDAGLAPDSTPTAGPTPTDLASSVSTPVPVSMATFSSPDLGVTLEYPENWQNTDDSTQALFSPSIDGLESDDLNDTSLRIGASNEEDQSISDLLTSVLASFPAGAESLNEGTISIASQTWTSTQIRFDDENLGGQGIATVAVTNKDGVGYYLMAVAPADEWNSMQPTFQDMINSFRFTVEEVLAQSSAGQATPSTEINATDVSGNTQTASTPVSEAQPATTPTPAAAATPVVYAIQSGDTLLEIAVNFGVDADLLASENGITNPEGLQLGQELIIPFTADELAAYLAGEPVTSSGPVESEADETTAGNTTANVTEAPPAEDAAEAASAPEPEAVPEEPVPQVAAAPVSGKIVYPAFSPGTNTYELWIADVASGEQTPFAGNASQPNFNKDGTLVAYRSWDLGTRGIFFKDFVGGRGGIVTRFVEDGLPTWAPDGFSFAFSSRKEGDRVARLYLGNQLGEDAIGLSFQGAYPATLPDGRLVAKGCTPRGDCGIFVMGARGGGETKIAEDPSDTAPAPSPDGNRIAFMSTGRGASNWEIWVMNSDGSNPQQLTENSNNDGLPAWSPDGQSIAFVSDRGGVWGIWVMNTDGSNQRKLIDMRGSPDGIVLHDEPNSKGWLEERISWAP